MSFDAFFYPKSIALVGASKDAGSVGNDTLLNLLNSEYSGKVYPVNPKYKDIEGVRCYANLSEIAATPDLVIIIVPAKIVPVVMEEVAQVGSQAVIIISAGFAETGESGAELEDRVRQIAKQHKIQIIGVNCLGLMNPEIALNASFAAQMPSFGQVALIAQSGALCTAVIDYAKDLGVGFSKLISVGNKTLFSEMEVIEYLDRDPQTKVIMMYLEDIQDPQAILKKAKYIQTPIVVLKAGRTQAGRAASASHTGALGSDDLVYQALFRQAGFIRAGSIQDLFNYAQYLAFNHSITGNRLAIITNAGGPGTITVDAAITAGLEIAKLSSESQKKLASELPAACSIHNPIDVLGDAKADRYRLALEVCLSDPNVDQVMVILTPQTSTEIRKTAELIIQASNQTEKVVTAAFMGSDLVAEAQKLLLENQVCLIPYPDQLAKIMGGAYTSLETKKDLTRFSDKDLVPASKESKVAKILQTAKKEGLKLIPEDRTKSILEAYDIPIIRSLVMTSETFSLDSVKTLKADKLALKVVSPDIVHKSDVGGVLLNIKPSEVEAGIKQVYKNIEKRKPEAKIEGVLVVPMVDLGSGFELIIGVKDQPNFGKSIMFGLGGTMVEVLKDITFSLAPIDLVEAERMINRIRAKQIFEGVRGRPRMDTRAIIETIVKISELVTDFPEIKELDINPFVVFAKGEGGVVLDSRIIL